MVVWVRGGTTNLEKWVKQTQGWDRGVGQGIKDRDVAEAGGETEKSRAVLPRAKETEKRSY